MSYITYPKPTEEECRAATSESWKYRHLVAPYCSGCGVDIGTQGAAVVPWGISYDLPIEAYKKYTGESPPKGPIHLRGFAQALPFEAKSLDWACSIHVIEDFDLNAWPAIIGEMIRCVKPGGRVIVVVPDKKLWEQHLASGGIANANHKHEYEPGDFAWVASQLGVQPPDERYTDACPSDYSYMAVFWVQ
jgi:SAM-dependent methyltransferase